MSSPYQGETDAKRLARLAIYNRAMNMQDASERKNGLAIVLSGPEAGEVGCLRDVLKFKPENTWFVDWESEKGLKAAQKKWPGVNIFPHDVKDLLNGDKFIKGNEVAFLHLDFMGYLDRSRENIVRLASYRLKPWGMAFYAFYRGREKPGVGFWDYIKDINADKLDERRFIGAVQILQQALGQNFLPVFSLMYTARSVTNSAMGIIGFQKVPNGFQRSTHWLRQLELPTPYGGAITADEKVLDAMLRVEALDLRSRGHTSKQVSAILNVGTGKVAAWFANQTRCAQTKKK